MFVDDLPGNLKPARGAGHGDGAAPRRPTATIAELEALLGVGPALIADHADSARRPGRRHPDLLHAADALGEHHAREHDRDDRVERAEDGDHAQQALGRRGRIEAVGARSSTPTMRELAELLGARGSRVRAASATMTIAVTEVARATSSDHGTLTSAPPCRCR